MLICSGSKKLDTRRQSFCSSGDRWNREGSLHVILWGAVLTKGDKNFVTSPSNYLPGDSGHLFRGEISLNEPS